MKKKVTITISDDVYSALKDKAKKEDRNLSNMVTVLLRKILLKK